MSRDIIAIMTIGTTEVTSIITEDTITMAAVVVTIRTEAILMMDQYLTIIRTTTDVETMMATTMVATTSMVADHTEDRAVIGIIPRTIIILREGCQLAVAVTTVDHMVVATEAREDSRATTKAASTIAVAVAGIRTRRNEPIKNSKIPREFFNKKTQRVIR